MAVWVVSGVPDEQSIYASQMLGIKGRGGMLDMLRGPAGTEREKHQLLVRQNHTLWLSLVNTKVLLAAMIARKDVDHGARWLEGVEGTRYLATLLDRTRYSAQARA